MGVNSLPTTVSRERCGRDWNPGDSAPESRTLTTQLPSHEWRVVRYMSARPCVVESDPEVVEVRQ